MGHEHFGEAGMWIIPVLGCIILMVVCFFFFMRGGFGSSWGCCGDRSNQGDSADSESALDILKKRYTRGEITQEDFERMKKLVLS